MVAASGDITYNRYVNIVGTGEWDLIGAPVSNMAFSSLITDANIATNGSFYAVGAYDNTLDTWTNATTATTGNLALGQGYQMATTSGGTLSFTGAIARWRSNCYHNQQQCREFRSRKALEFNSQSICVVS